MKVLLEILPFVNADTEELRIAKGKNLLAKNWKDMQQVNRQLHGRTNNGISGS